MTIARDPEIASLFTEARTHSAWLSKSVDDASLRRIYELVRMGPTSANSQPLRVVFVKSSEGKERLRPALLPLNVEKTMSAPVTAIIAYDSSFYERMPQLFPARPEMRDTLASLPAEQRDAMAQQSATLQAGYLVMAARAIGLDCGPMAGFMAKTVDAEFFPDGQWRTLLLINLGHGDPAKLYPRNPRLDFDQACRVA